MKQDTWIMCAKLFAAVLVGAGTNWVSAWAQWSNSGESPERSHWLGVIIPMTVLGGANAMQSFMSTSWSKYNESRKKQTPTQTP